MCRVGDKTQTQKQIMQRVVRRYATWTPKRQDTDEQYRNPKNK